MSSNSKNQGFVSYSSFEGSLSGPDVLDIVEEIISNVGESSFVNSDFLHFFIVIVFADHKVVLRDFIGVTEERNDDSDSETDGSVDEKANEIG